METKSRHLEIDVDSVECELVTPEMEDTMIELWYENRRYMKEIFWSEDNYGLTYFMGFFRDGSARHLFATYANVGSERERVGFFWLANLKDNRCDFSGAFRRRYWARGTESILRNVFAKVHDEAKIDYIFSFTPWKAARNINIAAGMQPCAHLPHWSKGKDVYGFVHINSSLE